MEAYFGTMTMSAPGSNAIPHYGFWSTMLRSCFGSVPGGAITEYRFIPFFSLVASKPRTLILIVKEPFYSCGLGQGVAAPLCAIEFWV